MRSSDLRQGNPNAAPRCGARTRRGCPCRGPAMKNGRCRMHGGGSTGAKTAEGRARIVAARTIHGRYSAESRAFQARLSALTRRARVLCAFVAADLSLEAVAPLIRQARASELPARRTGGRRPAPRPNTSCNQEQGEAMRGLMAMDLSARQATLLKKLIRDAAQTASAAGIQPIQPGAAPRAAAA